MTIMALLLIVAIDIPALAEGKDPTFLRDLLESSCILISDVGIPNRSHGYRKLRGFSTN